MVDTIRLSGDQVRVVSFDHNGSIGPDADADTLRIVLAHMKLDQLTRVLRQGERQFLKAILADMTASEMDRVAGVWTQIREELTEEEHVALDEVFPEEGADRDFADVTILKFIRAIRHPAWVRGDIADVTRRVKSLTEKAERVATEIAAIARSLEYETAEDINFSATEANLVSDDVLDGFRHLQEVLGEMAQKRDLVLKNGRRSNKDRGQFVREWIALWREVGLPIDGSMLFNAVSGAVEAVEITPEKVGNGTTKIGKGEREWVGPLIRDALSS